MAIIQPRGKATSKRFQFSAPTELVEEFTTKKELLESYNLSIDMAEDFNKVLKDAIKVMDKRLAEVSDSNNSGNAKEGHSQHNA